MPRFLGRFLPWPTVSRWPLSLQEDAQVRIRLRVQLRGPTAFARQYAFNRAIMPFMSVIFEGLRGGARQPMLTLIAPVFWQSGLQPNELVSAASTK